MNILTGDISFTDKSPKKYMEIEQFEISGYKMQQSQKKKQFLVRLGYIIAFFTIWALTFYGIFTSQ